MMLATSQTTTSWMLAMFSNATMTMTDMATELTSVAQSGRHLGFVESVDRLTLWRYGSDLEQSQKPKPKP
jgi:hypothetical protein